MFSCWRYSQLSRCLFCNLLPFAAAIWNRALVSVMNWSAVGAGLFVTLNCRRNTGSYQGGGSLNSRIFGIFGFPSMATFAGCRSWRWDFFSVFSLRRWWVQSLSKCWWVSDCKLLVSMCVYSWFVFRVFVLSCHYCTPSPVKVPPLYTKRDSISRVEKEFRWEGL